MDQTLQHAVVTRLIADFGFKDKGTWLQQGRCPECGKTETFTHAQAPWVIRCGRANKCGWEAHVKDLYRDLFENWSERFPTVAASPHATADAYMQFARGFELARVRGWYTQAHYRDDKAGADSATVRFAVGSTYWERLIDRPERFGKKKARFKPGGSYAGIWWKPPTLNLYGSDELWLVEGIFDAIALDHHDIPAVALLSCNNYPEQALADLLAGGSGRRPRLVWALDGDRAGRGCTAKWVRRAREDGWECDAAHIPQPSVGKLDWNDLHQRDRLSAAELSEYRYHGALLIAGSAAEKARLIYQRHGSREFPFDYDRRLYWFKLDLERFERAREAAAQQEGATGEEQRSHALSEASKVMRIANCLPTVLYYEAHPLTDESWYYFRIEMPNGNRPIKNTFTGAQVASAIKFKKRLLAIAPGALYTGNGAQLDRFLEQHMRTIRSVQTVDFVGYSGEHGCYVFNDVAVKDGHVYPLNDEDFFEIGKLNIKPISQSVRLTINADRATYQDDWFDLLWQCFGAKGIVALAFWLGALFSEQIRAEHKSYPFLELVGEPGAGKSTLLEFMWKLLGRRDYEGFDPMKSSLAARTRNFADVSGLPVVLIEGDRGAPLRRRSFDWDELKTAYNGRSMRATGVKDGGNEMREPPFRGAIIISQNATVAASEAVLQRIVHLPLSRAGHTSETKRMAELLEHMPLTEVSGFLLRAATREKEVMQCVTERTARYEDSLQQGPQASSMYVAKNHAQMMALVDALALVVDLSDAQRDAAHELLAGMASARQGTVNAEHPIVQKFWDIFDYLDGEGEAPRLNHARDASLIAVNLEHFAMVAAERRQQIPRLAELKRYLRTSVRRKFVDVRAVRSALRANDPYNRGLPDVLRCWVFKRG
jgi:hypothetical protein